MGWFTAADDGPTDSGVVILPPIGYEWWSAHRTIRTVAEQLAQAGHGVVRVDYDGFADSAGSGREVGRVAAWRASVRAAAAELRALGCTRVTILGVRLGALLGLLEAGAVGAAAVVAWEAPPSGRRLARELRMMSEPVPDFGGAIAVSGVIFDAEVLADLADLDPTGLLAPPAARIDLIGPRRDDLARHLEGLGVEVRSAQPQGADRALGVPAEDAVVPEDVVASLLAAVGSPTGVRLPPWTSAPAASFDWEATPITERVLRVGPDHLVGVLSEPAEGDPDDLVVWLNSGSEAHVGPGRAWVEYGRALAIRGHRSLRIDFSGWGESPDLGHAPGRPYDAHGVEETAALISALRADGYRRVVVAGLCAGAWIALRAAVNGGPDGVVALNPQLYWQPGDPVEALMKDTRVRRTKEREREERGGRYGLWTLLDRLGHRPWAGRWLDAIAAADVPVLLCFAEGDDGLEYLHNRLRRRLQLVKRESPVEVVEIPEIDHSMHRSWFRPRVVDSVVDFLERIDSGIGRHPDPQSP
jgi:pimeloyl-ACP methyl ester carboxylesterase